MKEFVDHIKRNLGKKKIDDNTFLLTNQKFTIDKKNFSNIQPADTRPDSVSFVDGGVCHILSTSDFCLSLLRVVELKTNSFEKGDKKRSKTIKKLIKKEIYTLITVEDNFYKIITYPKTDLENTKISTGDPEFNHNTENPFEKIANFLRRNLELKTVIESSSDLVILDGSTDSRTQIEKEKIGIIAKKKNINCAFSKTSRILTDKGNNINYVLSELMEGEWIYTLEKSNIFFVKLNKNSDYVFRLDFFNMGDKRESVSEAINYLKLISNDPVFLGYPFYLIEADKIARVSNDEKKRLLTKFKVLLGPNWKSIKKRLNASVAHDVLDTIL
jgi:hypothetical protein